MPGLVIGGQLLFLIGHRHRAALGAHQHLVLRHLEVMLGYHPLSGAGCQQRGFVHQVGQIGT